MNNSAADQEIIKHRRGKIEAAKNLKPEKGKLRPETANCDTRQREDGNCGFGRGLNGERPSLADHPLKCQLQRPYADDQQHKSDAVDAGLGGRLDGRWHLA